MNAARILRSDPEIQKCFATFEALRRLGFDSEDVYVGMSNVDGVDDTIFVELVSQDLSFVVVIGTTPYPMVEFGKRWTKVAEDISNIGIRELERVWKNSEFGSAERFLEFAMSLTAKGFIIPGLSPAPGDRS